MTGRGDIVPTVHHLAAVPNETARRLAVLGAVLMVALLCPVRLGLIVGNSLEPHISSRQPCLILRDEFADRLPQHGDLVLIRFDHEYLVKFVAALPGETVYYGLDRDGNDIVRTVLPTAQGQKAWRRGNEVVERLIVPPGTVFVMGGNPGSYDSRDFGPVPVDEVRGRVVPVLRPLSPNGHLPFATALYASGPLRSQ